MGLGGLGGERGGGYLVVVLQRLLKLTRTHHGCTAHTVSLLWAGRGVWASGGGGGGGGGGGFLVEVIC